MFYHPKFCQKEKNTLSKLSAAALIIGGVAATAYFGYRLMEKIRCKCHNKTDCDHTDGFSAMDIHDFEHVSENDCLCHDKKDYYGQCGCFDNEKGCSAGTEKTDET